MVRVNGFGECLPDLLALASELNYDISIYLWEQSQKDCNCRQKVPFHISTGETTSGHPPLPFFLRSGFVGSKVWGTSLRLWTGKSYLFSPHGLSNLPPWPPSQYLPVDLCVYSFVYLFSKHIGSVYWVLNIGIRDWNLGKHKTQSYFSGCSHSGGRKKTNKTPSSEYSGEEINRSMLRLYIVTLFI